MCTLTYVPQIGDELNFILTDNRDESVNRPAKFPKVYSELNSQLFYPKDKRAGGTWFGIGKEKRAMALLNGAFKRHKRAISYRKSRGLVVKELLAAKDLKKTIENYDFTGIEAFFGVIFSWENQMEIIEVIWDGEKKYLNNKAAKEPHIWSSAMTFSLEEHVKKEMNFQTFLKENQQAENLSELLWKFHQSKEAGMILDYGVLKTTSVSRFTKKGRNQYFKYRDLITKEEEEKMILWE